MTRNFLISIGLALVALAQPALAAEPLPDAIAALRAQDTRLALIADKLLTANAYLCRQTMPITGLAFHSRDQYGADGAAMFVHGDVTVSTIITGSPAALAGIVTDDGLLAIGSRAVGSLEPYPDAPLRDAVFEDVARQEAGAKIDLTLMGRDGAYDVSLQSMPGCRALAEIRSLNEIGARSDGRVIQVNYGLAAAARDNELAVIFAHELAHVVLEHRRRLTDAGVAKGFFGELGRNQRLNRQVEVEADRMSVHLLANAGYDPAIAAAFFRTSMGRRTGGGLFASTIYPTPEARAVLAEREIRDYLAAGGPSYPGHLLARREQPFD